tara:strand:+ start:682 stop:987 length:306 start_codon:yes stop_codon:yes gene_type:complete
MPEDRTETTSPADLAEEEWEELFSELQQEPRKQRWVWLVYLLLFAVAIPWYWPASYRGALVAGLPMWVAVTIGAIALLAGWTAIVIAKYWQDSDGADEAGE